MLTITIILAALALVANFLDCYTTYVGVYVKKVATESDSAAAWFSNTPLKLLTIKPLAIAGMGACFVVPVVILHSAAVAAIGGVVMGASTIYAGISAYRNYRINESKS